MTHQIVFPDAEDSLAPLFTGGRLARLENLGKFTVFYGGKPDPKEYIKRIGNANGIISNWGLSNEVLKATTSLEVISFVGLGISNWIDLAETTRLGITVTHTVSPARTIAEHTMALMLAAARHIARLDRQTRRGVWNNELVGFDLRGKKLGLVGFGRIAQATLPLAKAFGMRVVAWTRNPSAERAVCHDIEFVDLDVLLAESDVISIHLLLTPETEGIINADRLRKTKQGVVLINTARGQILDETALIELLSSHHIAAAGIDVFNQEPLAQDYAFLGLDNIVMTPHNAYNTTDAVADLYDIVIDNLEAFFTGNPRNVAELE